MLLAHVKQYILTITYSRVGVLMCYRMSKLLFLSVNRNHAKMFLSDAVNRNTGFRFRIQVFKYILIKIINTSFQLRFVK